jgi:hypothetical protein
MATVDFETAQRCPKCDQPGEIMSTTPARDNKGRPCKIHRLRCQNNRCRWFETDWVVQQLEDGTVPIREGLEQKTFPAVPGMTQEKAAEQIEAIVDDDADKRRK